jgi:hypothetical protein
MGMGEAGQILGQLKRQTFLRWGQRGWPIADLNLEEIAGCSAKSRSSSTSKESRTC